MKAKKNKNSEAQGPLGAAPQMGEVGSMFKRMGDPKALRKALIDMAKRVEKDPKKRKAFIDQGMIAIDQQEARKATKERFTNMLADLKVVFEKHDVKAFHLITNLEVNDKVKKLGVSGWAASQKIGDASVLELMGMLTQSAHELSRSVGSSHF